MIMELRSTRRIVTGHDKDGKAVALYDAPLNAIQRSAGGNGMTLCWVTSEFPVDMASAADRAQTKVGVPPPANGTIFRIVDSRRRRPAATAPSIITRSCSTWASIR